jgi:hypothetical protein
MRSNRLCQTRERAVEFACFEEVYKGKLPDHKSNDRKKQSAFPMVYAYHTHRSMKAEHFKFLNVDHLNYLAVISPLDV